ncbi:hypothetical protein HPB51_028300 [Rhipicephalus microplus]|uniref:Uncharacterized protein n=1 Tax=Rhipicephalus microplus TaxID=6941 RepID=A0A9J6CXN9_RHIMP|nr:hypothetical protein HPB51_028300 [Rhipicephalus microplus]
MARDSLRLATSAVIKTPTWRSPKAACQHACGRKSRCTNGLSSAATRRRVRVSRPPHSCRTRLPVRAPDLLLRVEEIVFVKEQHHLYQSLPLDTKWTTAAANNWLQSELFVVTESKKLEHHLASLIDERKTIAMEIHIVEKQLKDPDMAQADRVEHDARLHELKSALKEHYDDIAKLQQKILDVDPDRHFKNFASNVTDITESRAIVRSLFEMLVAENMTTYTTAGKLREQERATAEGQKKIRQLQAEFQQAREDYDMKLTNLLKEHQEEKLVFLKHSANATLQSNPDLDTSIVEKLEGQELASVKGGRVAFFEDVSPVKKPKKKPETSNTGNKMSSFTFADLDTTIDFDSDGENDQEMTPTGFSAVNDAR